MAALERSRSESLDRKEQAAFSELSDTLIFGAPTNFKLSRDTVPQLSKLVQESFRKQDQLHEKLRNEFITDQIMQTLDKMRKSLQETPEPENVTEQQEELKIPQIEVEKKHEGWSDTEKIFSAANLYILEHGREYWQHHGYGAWGFTPALAAMRTENYEQPYEKDGKNCFGVVQGLGAMFNEMELEFEMGITTDHPFIVIQLGGKVHLASLFGIQEAKGTFERHEGYKTYTPSPEDKIPYKVMTVWNFNEGLVYELLENFEVLRQMSLGNKVENLPGTEESGMKLAEQHRGTLQGASWRMVQEKVTPQLAKYFHDHEREWAAEHERISFHREVSQFFTEVMDAGQAATSMKGLSFDDFKKKFLPVAKEHGQAIVNLIVSGAECGPDTPDDIVLFAHGAKDVLEAISIPELRVEVTQGFLRPFVAKE